jgi:hypothetical protein
VFSYIDQLKRAESEEEIGSVENQIQVVDQFGYRSALIWFRNGMKSIFLQDADSLIIPPSEIVEILEYLREKFPSIDRVTSYARSSTIAKIKEEDIKAIADAGLNRIHIGLESGSDKVLKRVRKGASKKIHIEAGRKVKNAGIELSEYLMPGLGGRKFSNEHALESADVLSRINPDFIRLRHLAVPEGKSLFDEFEPINDVDVVQELRLFIQHLDVKDSWILSDHILNLIPEINGKLPDDKNRILNYIDYFLNLDQYDQTLFQLGRRMGVFQRIGDLDDIAKRKHVMRIYKSKGISPSNIDEITREMMQRYI